MRKINLLILSLLFIASPIMAQNIQQISTTDYLTIKSDSPEKIEVFSLTKHDKNYFQDEVDAFLLQFSQLDLAKELPADLTLIVDSLSFPLVSLDPIFIRGLGEGDHTIKFTSKEDLPFIGTNKIEFCLGDTRPLFTNDAIVFGLLMAILAFIFWTSQLKALTKFYAIVPALLLCYFIPSIFNSLDIINSHVSGLYGMAKNYLLPAALVLLCLSIDLKGIVRLGPKALIMFFTATIGIVIGGPIALWMCASWFPEVLEAAAGEEIWRGLSTVAGSWIGGGANQTAMKEINDVGDTIFSQMIIVDVFIANIFMSLILFGIGKRKKIDKWLKADNSGIDALQEKMQTYNASVSKIPTFKDVIVMVGVVFMAIGTAHVFAQLLGPFFKGIVNNPYFSFLSSGFFWIVVLATVFGVLLSFTKAKKMEGVGASRVGSIFIYILVATIGMKMDIEQLITNWQTFKFLIIIGLIWISIHGALLLIMAKLVKAPYFFAAVGSQANVGGAASAPVVAGAFHPSLAPVGVLLAVLGYAVGTIGAIICSSMLMAVAG